MKLPVSLGSLVHLNVKEGPSVKSSMELSGTLVLMYLDGVREWLLWCFILVPFDPAELDCNPSLFESLQVSSGNLTQIIVLEVAVWIIQGLDSIECLLTITANSNATRSKVILDDNEPQDYHNRGETCQLTSVGRLVPGVPWDCEVSQDSVFGR